jgi:signal peptidase I
MTPTIPIDSQVVVDEGAYTTRAPKRGDIVVFTRPHGEIAAPQVKDLIKRIIGLPGETISSPDGRVWIDGKPLSEPWLPKGTVTTAIRVQTLLPNQYFVMGDNRPNSQDSRFFGPISAAVIVGKVILGGCG